MAVVGAFALLHGHVHGSEVPKTGGLVHMAGFALATVTLHGLGIEFAVSARRVRCGSFVRLTGMREDGERTPAASAAIDRCLSVADDTDIQVVIHTGTFNGSGFVGNTVTAFKGGTIHAFHNDGAGGGHHHENDHGRHRQDAEHHHA